MASGSSRAIVALAQPMHGAVLRATGSAITCAGETPGSAASVASTRLVPVEIHTRSRGTSGAMRRTVAAMSGSSERPASGKSCFGVWRREAGQKRVPEPPARITAWTCGMGRFVPWAAPWHDEQTVTAEIAFDLALEHGKCVGVRIPSAEEALRALAGEVLSPEEQARAGAMPLPRRRTWVGGRAAMREALAREGLSDVSVPSDPRGAPVLPTGIAGSITHKEGLAAALVAREP